MTSDFNKSRTGIGWTEDRRAQQSIVRKKSWQNEARRRRMAQIMHAVAADPAYRERMSESCRESWTPQRRDKQSEVAARVNADPERKKRQSELMSVLNRARAGQKWSPERKALHKASLSAKKAAKSLPSTGVDP